jgi:hypothetical protein
MAKPILLKSETPLMCEAIVSNLEQLLDEGLLVILGTRIKAEDVDFPEHRQYTVTIMNLSGDTVADGFGALLTDAVGDAYGSTPEQEGTHA